MYVLRVIASTTSVEQRGQLASRFGRFYDGIRDFLDYPVSCDTHAEDVLRDSFISRGIGYIFAGVYEGDDVEWYQPFDEEDGGPISIRCLSDEDAFAPAT